MNDNIEKEMKHFIHEEFGVNSEICHAVHSVGKLDKLMEHFEEVYKAGYEAAMKEAVKVIQGTDWNLKCKLCKQSDQGVSFVKLKNNDGFICTNCDNETWGG